MKKLRNIVQKIQNNFFNKIPSNDMATMLCFFLGIYGERFFTCMYIYIKKVSPEAFCFICLTCTYLIIMKFMGR